MVVAPSRCLCTFGDGSSVKGLASPCLLRRVSDLSCRLSLILAGVTFVSGGGLRFWCLDLVYGSGVVFGGGGSEAVGVVQ
ncbi:hypothetical protein P8452_18058 [Trifolium repens]|nr:hypothetical protein P8452_18058 [Trifolium repens]